MIDSAPEIACLPIDGDDDLVEIPDIITAWRLALKATRVVGAEFGRLALNGFVGYDNAELEQHFLDQTQAQGKSRIQPDDVCNDLGRKTMTLVADRTLGHAAVSTRPITHSRLT